jgi:hypothetical protein
MKLEWSQLIPASLFLFKVTVAFIFFETHSCFYMRPFLSITGNEGMRTEERPISNIP